MKGRTKNFEPCLDAPRLAPPSFLCVKARRVFRTVETHLRGNVRSEDIPILAAFSQAYIRWQEAEAILTREGLTLGDKVHPASKLSDQYGRTVRLYASQLGLSPLARAKLNQSPGASEQLELRAFLDGTGG